MYYLSLMIRGGHTVCAVMPEDLRDRYRRDPITFGIAVEDLLDQSRVYTVKDLHGRDIYIRPKCVVAWEVEESGDLG